MPATTAAAVLRRRFYRSHAEHQRACACATRSACGTRSRILLARALAPRVPRATYVRALDSPVNVHHHEVRDNHVCELDSRLAREILRWRCPRDCRSMKIDRRDSRYPARPSRISHPENYRPGLRGECVIASDLTGARCTWQRAGIRGKVLREA